MDKNDFHARLIQAVVDHTKDSILLSAWLQGKMTVSFWRGIQCGKYAGNQMFMTDKGLVDADPAAITGVTFENTIDSEDAEIVIKGLQNDLENLKAIPKKEVDRLFENESEVKDKLAGSD